MSATKVAAPKLRRGWITRSGSLEGLISDAMSEFQSLRDEMTEWKDNMEERLSNTPKYAEVEECVDALEQFCDNDPDFPTDALPDGLTDEMTWQEPKPKRRQSRGDRLSSAIQDVQRVAEHIEGFCDAHKDDDSLDDWRQLATDLNDLVGEAEGVSFPGMY